MPDKKPIHTICPCCPYNRMVLRNELRPAVLSGPDRPCVKYVGPPVVWYCDWCGFSLMGLAVPIRRRETFIVDGENGAAKFVGYVPATVGGDLGYDIHEVHRATDVEP